MRLAEGFPFALRPCVFGKVFFWSAKWIRDAMCRVSNEIGGLFVFIRAGDGILQV